MKTNLRRIGLVLVCLLLLLSMAACGAEPMGSGKDSANLVGRYPTADEEYNYSDSIADPSEKPSAEENLPENRKLVQKLWLNVETEDLDALLTNVQTQVAQLGGYIEAQNIQNGSSYSGYSRKTGTLTVRIPAKNLSQFTQHVDECSNVVSSNKTTEDVTLSYVATESRKKALEVEEERLFALMEKADNLSDLLVIEERLTQVRTELEQVISAMRVFDNQVDYATVYLSATQVTVYTEKEEPPVTVWDRMASGFMDSVEFICDAFVELSVLFVSMLPILLLLLVVFGVFGLVVWLIVRKILKTRQKKNP